jgi:hypothetical protein
LREDTTILEFAQRIPKTYDNFEFYPVGDLVNKIVNDTPDNILHKDEVKYDKNKNLKLNNFFKKKDDSKKSSDESEPKSLKDKKSKDSENKEDNVINEEYSNNNSQFSLKDEERTTIQFDPIDEIKILKGLKENKTKSEIKTPIKKSGNEILRDRYSKFKTTNKEDDTLTQVTDGDNLTILKPRKRRTSSSESKESRKSKKKTSDSKKKKTSKKEKEAKHVNTKMLENFVKINKIK